MKTFPRVLSIAVLLWIGASASAVVAYDYVYWCQPAGGSFLSSLNWTMSYPPTYPGNINPVSITNGSLRFALGQSTPYTVTLGGTASTQPLVVENDRVLINLQGRRLTTTGASLTSLDVGVGNGDYGELTLINGTFLAKGAGVAASSPNSTGTLYVDTGATLELNESALLVVGSGDSYGSTEFTSQGNLIVRNGGKVLDVGTNPALGFWVGGNPGHGVGNVTVDGTGSRIHTRGKLYLGTWHGGQGNLTVSAGGEVEANQGVFIGNANSWYPSYDSSFGTATITGTNSRLIGSLMVGCSRPGSLGVFDGAMVISSGSLIGIDADGVGTVTISGVGSIWNDNDSISVGRSGMGTLKIEAGGQVSSAQGYLGYATGSTGMATVTGTGSTWSSSGSHCVGREGMGTLTVEAGAQVSNVTNGYIAFSTGSMGTAVVTGASSTWSNGYSLYIGNSGGGTLTVEAGGQVDNYFGYLGYSANSSGSATITGAGSTWANSGSIFVGYEGAGTLTIAAGGQVSNLNGFIGGNSGSTGAVTVTGAGSTWTNSNGLSVGRYGTGMLAITNGGLVSVEGTLAIDYNGGNYSFVNMATGGMLALFGDADDSLSQFLGLVKGTDTIRYWENSTSEWAPLTSATPGVDFTLACIDDTSNYLYGYTLLTVGIIPDPVPGDTNGDYTVNADDAEKLAANWLQQVQGGFADGDFNGDCMVNDLDAAIMAANWGHVQGPAKATTGEVPEPGIVVLLLCGVSVALAGRKCADIR